MAEAPASGTATVAEGEHAADAPDAESAVATEAMPGVDVAPVAGTPEEEQKDAEPPVREAAAAAPSVLHGSLSMRYRGRFTGEDQDHELRSVLALDLADPKAPWFAGHFLARAEGDLDGLDEGAVFQDLSDTYDSSLVTKLYLAYADIALGDRLGDGSGTLRVGRQSDPRLPEFVRLDGASYVTGALGPRALELGLYGGIPVHLYESSPEGDRAYGTFVEGRPWEGGHARLDWMHLEDERTLGTARDDLLGLGLWQTLARHLRLEGELTRLEGEPRDLRLRAFYEEPESETIVRVGYYELQETQVFRTTELDPFSDVLLESFPFRQATLDVSRALSAHTVLDAGCDLRRVRDAADVGEFNRDWERYRAAFTLRDAGLEGLDLTVSADRWNDSDRDTSSLGADLAFAREAWRASLGTYYSLYKYELLELREREDVRTYYVNTSRELSKSLRLDLSYELEDDDFDVYHTVRLGALWRF